MKIKIGTKLFLLAVLLVGLNFPALAQSNKESVDLYQAAFGMAKKDVVAGFLKLPAESPFWVTYDKYETERKSIGQKRLKLLQDYASNYLNMTDAQIESMMKENITLNNSANKLIDTYYSNVKKVSGTKTAAQFYQIEQYIQSSIRVEIMDNIPFIGELDKVK